MPKTRVPPLKEALTDEEPLMLNPDDVIGFFRSFLVHRAHVADGLRREVDVGTVEEPAAARAHRARRAGA
jgi:hypothetical protein